VYGNESNKGINVDKDSRNKKNDRNGKNDKNDKNGECVVLRDQHLLSYRNSIKRPFTPTTISQESLPGY